MSKRMNPTSLRRRRVVLALSSALALSGVAVSPSLLAQAAASQDRIIVSGASGQLGGLVVKELLARGVPAKNLILVSRTPETLAEYAKQGAATRFGDFGKPESLRAAYAGGTKMLLISIGGGLGSRAEAHKNAIDAAVAAGVKHIAYTSYVALSQGDASGLGADHAKTEEILKQSGASWTMLRNSIYSEATLPAAAQMVATGKYSVAPNEAKVGHVTRGDCAAAAAAVLTTPGHENKAYDITGPELIGAREIAAAAAAVSGKKLQEASASEVEPPRSFGGPSSSVVSKHVEQLTGRPAVGLRQFYQENRNQLLGQK